MKCARCAKDVPERSIHCPFCGTRLRSINEVIEFPGAPGRGGPGSPDWRAELSAKVRQVKERRNLQEARGRLQAEIEAAAQRYQQAGVTTTTAQSANNYVSAPAPENLIEAEGDRHPNPIIDAALRRARRASEMAVKKQPIISGAAAPKMPPQVQSNIKTKPATAQTQIVEAQPCAAAPALSLAIEIETAAAAQAETVVEANELLTETVIPPAEQPAATITPVVEPPAVVKAPDEGLDSIERSRDNQPVRVIKENDSGPNYLDELIVIAEQNLCNDHARVVQRMVATVIDVGIMVLATLPYWAISYYVGGNFLDKRVLIMLASATLSICLLYLVLSVALAARTFGMMFVGIRVINTVTGAPPSLFQAIMRGFGYALALATAGLGFLIMFIDRERRGLHDFVSGTTVVRDF